MFFLGVGIILAAKLGRQALEEFAYPTTEPAPPVLAVPQRERYVETKLAEIERQIKKDENEWWRLQAEKHALEARRHRFNLRPGHSHLKLVK